MSTPERDSVRLRSNFFMCSAPSSPTCRSSRRSLTVRRVYSAAAGVRACSPLHHRDHDRDDSVDMRNESSLRNRNSATRRGRPRARDGARRCRRARLRALRVRQRVGPSRPSTTNLRAFVGTSSRPVMTASPPMCPIDFLNRMRLACRHSRHIGVECSHDTASCCWEGFDLQAR